MNNSSFEQNKFLSEIESLKKNKETEKYYRDILSGIYNQFNVDSRIGLMKVSREYLDLKENLKRIVVEQVENLDSLKKKKI
ncbi:Uncharacterised protein [Clostridium perfringens]|uniref:Uncharacterized protein n=1 Tax=Clostridium perfringens TaxID=1502 RepID=A0A2X2YEG4_CLOPF|nr:hypothetical protein [Clostridium perfringens]SQB61383.1 Uncharacterised protein [Clostridium perfringens]